MFSRTIAIVTALAVSVSALTINTPSGWKGNTTNPVTWTSAPSDPTMFSIYLVADQFHPSIGIAGNVQTALGSISVPLPRLTAGDGFIVEFVDISNINNVLAMSGPFSIAENDVDGQSSTATSGTATAASTAPGTPGASVTSQSETQTVSPTVSTPPGSSTSNTDSSSSGSASNTSGGSVQTPGSAPSISVSGGLLTAALGLLIMAA